MGGESEPRPQADDARMQAQASSDRTLEGHDNFLRIADLCLEWLPDAELKAKAGAEWP